MSKCCRVLWIIVVCLIGCLVYKGGFYVYVKWWVSRSCLIVVCVGCYLWYFAIVELCISGFVVEINVVSFWFFDGHKVG